MRQDRKTLLAGAGGVAAAVGSALCCAGPLIAVATGVSAAGLAPLFEPLRPWLLGASAAFLALGFRVLDREERLACEPGRPCAEPRVRRRMKAILWFATMLALAFASFPAWQSWVLTTPR